MAKNSSSNSNADEDTSASEEKFTLFWDRDSPFSQHHPRIFTVNDVQYNCAEQYMMHQKALRFGDTVSAEQIMNTSEPDEQKAFGRKVLGYDDKIWDKASMEVVKAGNIAKFSQNDDLRTALFATAGTALVEASPYDRKWGIGLGEKNPKALQRKHWRGENRLGVILTQVREELMASKHK